MTNKHMIEKHIREAYVFLRENNNTIPSDVLEFMKDAALQKIGVNRRPDYVLVDDFENEFKQYTEEEREKFWDAIANFKQKNG